MLIGIDLDNTIVCYDRVFERLAYGLELPRDVASGGKQAIRDFLRRQNREDEWTEMQGKAYGSWIGDAQPFEGVLEFMASARQLDHALCIVSHRTKQPFLGEPVDLHAAAQGWLREHGIDRLASVFLEETAADKAARIHALGCDVFIDDLPEFLSRPDFPVATRKLRFHPAGAAETGETERVSSWAEATKLLLSA
ncbi:MAG: hypothetical protein RIQ71_1658 [Verrucomicrobiota bacterium]|jgi:hypothetical protein